MAEAIRLQLDHSRSQAQCSAMVLADEDGLCLSAVGDGPLEEIAVYSAMLGNKVENFEGTLYSHEACFSVRIRRFTAAGARLVLCAVGGGGEPRASGIQRSVGGVSRILAAA